MLFSIIVPAYNVEKYIRQNVEAVIDMHNEDVELILVDDGSTDSTYEICKEYAAKYSFIKTVTETNGGQGKARNTGLSIASGEWVYFVDADDFILPNGLNHVIAKIKDKSFDGDVVVFNTLSYYESTGKFDVFSGHQYPKNMNGSRGADFFANVLKTTQSYGYCVVFFATRKKTLIDNGIKSGSEGTSNDINFSIQVWNKARSVHYFDEDVYAYRREQPGSITHNPNKKWMMWILNRIRWNLDYIKNSVSDADFQDWLTLSNFNLYLVVFTSATKLGKVESKAVLRELKPIRKAFVLNNKEILKLASGKIRLTYFLNEHVHTVVFFVCWRIFNSIKHLWG